MSSGGTGGGGGIILHNAVPTVQNSTLLQTIVTDLHAGESWFVGEAESAGLFLWNTLKAAFIALAPAETAILTNLLSGAVVAAAGGKSIEDIETAALSSASAQEQALMVKAGSGVVQTLIAGLKTQVPASPAP